MYKVRRYYNDKPPKTTIHETRRGARCAYTRHLNDLRAWYSESDSDHDTIVKIWHEEGAL